MERRYEINELAKEESWRMFQIIGELVSGFDNLAGIEPAVTIWGSSRLKTDEKLYAQTQEIARRLGQLGFSIVTGGGPGVMEAANSGALQAGVTSVGLNIELPEEQTCNAFSNKSMTFHHFFVRKVMLVKYATAFIVMPGGLGTLDELTEILVLSGTTRHHRCRPPDPRSCRSLWPVAQICSGWFPGQNLLYGSHGGTGRNNTAGCRSPATGRCRVQKDEAPAGRPKRASSL